MTYLTMLVKKLFFLLYVLKSDRGAKISVASILPFSLSPPKSKVNLKKKKLHRESTKINYGDSFARSFHPLSSFFSHPVSQILFFPL
ncbi:hypothetical protein ERO13_A04G104966v2 [Gossypium hirsutum]|nr:hypothetical protein ERO13_A04G104966v2 [Gossypium hirsutum]